MIKKSEEIINQEKAAWLSLLERRLVIERLLVQYPH